MKKLAIISAMLVFTLGMSAQTNDRSRNTQEKSEKTVTDRKTAPARETTKSTTPAATKSATKSEPSRSATKATPAPSNNQNATRTRTEPSGNQNATRTRTEPSNNQKATRTTSEPNNNGATRTRTTEPTRTSPANRSTDSRNSGNTSGVNRSRTPESGNVNQTRKVGTPSNDNRREATTRTGNSAPRTTNNSGVRQSSNAGQNHYDPKEGKAYEARRKVYSTPSATRRVVNYAPAKHYTYSTVEYRRVHYPYRSPSRVNIIWTNHMHHEYVYLYPEYDLWYYPYGYRIHTVSAYDAISYVGEVAQIYGKVYDTWYSRETDEFYLFFGAPYPYQDFSVILTGKDARRYSRRPDAFFIDRHMSVTGLVSLWEGKPEMVIKRRSQIDLY